MAQAGGMKVEDSTGMSGSSAHTTCMYNKMGSLLTRTSPSTSQRANKRRPGRRAKQGYTVWAGGRRCFQRANKSRAKQWRAKKRHTGRAGGRDMCRRGKGRMSERCTGVSGRAGGRGLYRRGRGRKGNRRRGSSPTELRCTGVSARLHPRRLRRRAQQWRARCRGRQWRRRRRGRRRR